MPAMETVDQLYQVTHKHFLRLENADGERIDGTEEEGYRVLYETGDAFYPTPAELDAFGERLRPVAGAPSQPEPVQEPAPEPDLDILSEEQLVAVLNADQFPWHKGGGYYLLPDGEKVQGEANAEAALAELEAEDGGDDEDGE